MAVLFKEEIDNKNVRTKEHRIAIEDNLANSINYIIDTCKDACINIVDTCKYIDEKLQISLNYQKSDWGVGKENEHFIIENKNHIRIVISQKAVFFWCGHNIETMDFNKFDTFDLTHCDSDLQIAIATFENFYDGYKQKVSKLIK